MMDPRLNQTSRIRRCTGCNEPAFTEDLVGDRCPACRFEGSLVFDVLLFIATFGVILFLTLYLG
jgi:hypothetical protein